MKLYDYILSAECYSIRLFAALTDIEITLRPVDFHPGKEHLSAELLGVNPAGAIPILQDGETVVTDPTSILKYLAQRHAPQWYGNKDAAQGARDDRWLAFSTILQASLGAARLKEMLHFEGDAEALKKAGIDVLRELEAALFEQNLRGMNYLTDNQPTIADIACFPHIALAPDGNITLDPYPRIHLWLRNIRALSGFIEMPGIHRLHELIPAPA